VIGKLNLDQIIAALEQSEPAVQKLAQSLDDLETRQENIGSGTARLTQDILTLFNSIDDRASQIAAILNALADITDFLRAQNNTPLWSTSFGNDASVNGMTPSLNIPPRTVGGMSHSRAQVHTFFARAVKRGLRGL